LFWWQIPHWLERLVRQDLNHFQMPTKDKETICHSRV
jgi:hypothetical protein